MDKPINSITIRGQTTKGSSFLVMGASNMVQRNGHNKPKIVIAELHSFKMTQKFKLKNVAFPSMINWA